jgi:uncharacterized PurR-regulated membrane protein YhhQ (DUF165 family)
MYFVRYGALKYRLRERSLWDNEVLPYFLLDCVLAVLPSAYERFGFLLISFRVIFAIGGVLYAYHCNERAFGFDLVQKFIVLGWVVNFRCLLVALLVLIVLSASGISAEDVHGLLVILVPVVDIIVYQRIGRHIRDTTE